MPKRTAECTGLYPMADKKKRRVKEPCTEDDRNALCSVDISTVPDDLMSNLCTAVDGLDLSLFKTLTTQWGSGKRLQATFGTNQCEIDSYKFSRLDNVIIVASGPMLSLIEHEARRMGVNANKVIGHVNYYMEGTGAGCGAHQDDEACIDQHYPITGYQVGGPATFHVWCGPPGDRRGATATIHENQRYVMPPGFQLSNWHAVTRNKVTEKKQWRCNITFRVVCK